MLLVKWRLDGSYIYTAEKMHGCISLANPSCVTTDTLNVTGRLSLSARGSNTTAQSTATFLLSRTNTFELSKPTTVAAIREYCVRF